MDETNRSSFKPLLDVDTRLLEERDKVFSFGSASLSSFNLSVCVVLLSGKRATNLDEPFRH